MSSKYQSQALVIPEGFPALLKGFAREVLRVQVRGGRARGPGDCHRSLLERSGAPEGARVRPKSSAACAGRARLAPVVRALHPSAACAAAPAAHITPFWSPVELTLPRARALPQPDDVYAFGARYFSDLAAARARAAGSASGGGGGGGVDEAAAPRQEQEQEQGQVEEQ